MALLKTPPIALTIAGCDSGGGAGISADTKTFQQLGVYGTCVITCITAQNTLGVQGLYPQTTECIMAQLESVLSDINIGCIKTGVLYNANIIRSVAAKVKKCGPPSLVVDPVLVSTSQHSLSDGSSDIIKSYIEDLFPIATVITPNIEEAEALTGVSITSLNDAKNACNILHRSSRSSFILLKGGHLLSTESDLIVDLVFNGSTFFELYHPKIHKQFHGSGCALSSAIASYLAKGAFKQYDTSHVLSQLSSADILQAIFSAIQFVRAGLSSSYPVGHDLIPINHFATVNEESLFQKGTLFTGFKSVSRSFWDNYTRSHPFLLQLISGSLTMSSFKYYLAQDHHYLLAVHKSFEANSKDPIFEPLNILFTYEIAEFVELLSNWNISLDDLTTVPQSESASEYISFLQRHIASKDLLSCCMSILPCIAGYAEAASYLEDKADQTSPYMPWLHLYAGQKYQDYSLKCLALFNDLVMASNLTVDRMYSLYEIYFKAVELEIQFFSHALR